MCTGTTLDNVIIHLLKLTLVFNKGGSILIAFVGWFFLVCILSLIYFAAFHTSMLYKFSV